MKKLKFVLFVFFVSSLLIAQEAQEKSGAKNINTVTKAPAKVIDTPQGAIKTNNNITVVTYDFTTGDGTNTMEQQSLLLQNKSTTDCKWAMIAGDADGSGIDI
ncbi:MAG: hypothetical protein H6609_00450 [Ignavibacteriales bacterium]|nr:hypothetical protein [Ignavibacteriales bacterium]